MLQSAVDLTPVTPAHVAHVAAHAREADRVEIYEASRREVAHMLPRSVECSDRTATLTVYDEAVAIIGVGRLTTLSDTGVPWMIGTDMVSRHARYLLPFGADVVRKMMQGHTVLRNMVHVENVASIRWLRSLGFTLHGPASLGWRGASFYVFDMHRDKLNV